MSSEWLNTISTLLGVCFGAFLGAFITPYVDARRSNKESKHAMNCFYSELDDYFDDSPEYVNGFLDCHKKSVKTELNFIKKDEDLFPLHFYPIINFLTIDNLIEKSFLDLTKDQRKGVKALKTLSDEINKKRAVISKYRTVKEFKKARSESYSATTACASWHYLLKEMRKKERFTYVGSTDEIIKKTMNDLNLSFDDIVFSRTDNKPLS